MMQNSRPFWISFSLFAALSCATAQAQNASATALTATPSAVDPGASVMLSASVQVAGGDPAPTGTVLFTVNGNTVASSPVLAGVAQYTASSSGLPPGVYPVVASYGGDSNTAASHSAAVPVTIHDYTSTTMLAINPGTVGRGSDATATATVTSASGQPATGTVTFRTGGNILATTPLTNGQASFSGSSATLPAGTYPVTASYNGNPQTTGSSSAAVNFTVKGVTSTAFTIVPAVVAVGDSVTLQVTVSTNGGIAAAGNVAFYAGTSLLTQATVVGGTASVHASTSGYAPGNYTLTANYLGDAKNLPSTGTTQVSLEGVTHAFSITPAGAALATGGTAAFSVTPAPGSQVTWYVNGVAGGSAASGTISSSGVYVAPSSASPATALITATEASSPNKFSAAVPVYVVVPGSVGTSNNQQVAAYTINAPQGGQMSVQFGLDTTYGNTTWQQPTPTGGGAVRMLVAGMQAPATYHMRATVDFGSGLVYQDPDQTFAAVRAIPPIVPIITQTPGLTPQPGIEVIDPIGDNLYAYDLQGNFIWGMGVPPGGAPPSIWHPIKLLPNGHLLTQFSPENAYSIDGTTIPPNTVFSAYEMELDGTIVKQVTLAQLNKNLTASGYRDGLGNQITLTDIHHDITMNPVTGHWIMMSNTTRVITGDPGTSGPTTVLGDVVLDVDPNNNFAVDWVFNEFDHLDVDRHPLSIQDRTHSNAIVYSADDHNILISIRHQSWIIKVDYDDGAGSSNILWRFGYQGDFTLVNGTSPQDWQFAQHLPSFTTSNTTGVFGLTMMDNGDGRILAAGSTCPVALTNGQCLYSRMPQFTVDENTMTATLGTVPPFMTYNSFGGNAEVLANGDPYADFCSVVSPNHPTRQAGFIVEYTPGDSPQLVWSMDVSTITAYRALRWDSFYPGIVYQQQ